MVCFRYVIINTLYKSYNNIITVIIIIIIIIIIINVILCYFQFNITSCAVELFKFFFYLCLFHM